MDEDFYESDDHDEFYDLLFNMSKDWFSEMLFEDYRNTCTE
jgi:hypothetical protein